MPQGRETPRREKKRKTGGKRGGKGGVTEEKEEEEPAVFVLYNPILLVATPGQRK